jgi:hypothetical protein
MRVCCGQDDGHARCCRPLAGDITLAEESAATCEFDEPIVDGDRAAVLWRGSTQLKHGGGEELRGVSLLRFDVDGLVIEQRDVWAMR